MLLSYLKLSLRLMARNPFFTFINVAGLSVGFAVFFILWPFTHAELKSDQFITDHEKIVRLIQDFRWTDNGGESWGHLNISIASIQIANEMRSHPAIQDATRFVPQQFFHFKNTPGLYKELVAEVDRDGKGPILFRLQNAICADKNFFDFFGLPLKYGNPQAVLDHADAIVISEKKSIVLFGSENPVGKLIKVNSIAFLVSGVFEDLPANSHLEVNYVFSNVGILNYWNVPGDFALAYQYFKSGHPDQLASIFNENKDRLIGEFLNRNQHIKIDFFTQPLNEVAFGQLYTNDYFKPKSKFMLQVLGGISIVILIMAWMNYVNLTVSKTKSRFKEMAARKVSGAVFHNLLTQFICQSVVVNALAVLIGLTLIQFVKVPFSQLLNIYVLSWHQQDWNTILFFATIFTSGVVATAVYPAWVILKHSTHQLLTKQVPANRRITTSIFTTAQYVAALALIAWIFVMNDQLEFILKKDLGLDRENVIVVESPVTDIAENGVQKMKEFARVIGSILGEGNLTMSLTVCGESPFHLELRRVGSDVFYGIDTQGGVDENFIPLYNLKLIAGRNFVSDENKKTIILSRMTSERLGFESPERALGSIIETRVDGVWLPVEVIGVMEDYRVQPFLMEEGSTESVTGRGQALTFLNNVWPWAVPLRSSVKIQGRATSDIKAIEKTYSQLFPGNLFGWYFLDENVSKQYGDQKIDRNQLTFFTFLAVGVACLGLLGMVSNKVVEKMKEISIRRILGAGHLHVTTLLLNSTAMQLGAALVIGLPIAWKFSNQYLEKFTERIEVQWWHFTVPVLILISIMLVTIASVLWKAARNNPVEALKYE